MIERVSKFFLCLALMPIFWCVLLIMAMIVLVLPIAALIRPDMITYKKSSDDTESVT